MQKIHGEYSIQPLTIVDAVVSDTAAIQEHKLELYHHTDELNQDITDLANELAAHKADNIDPHTSLLHQTTLRLRFLESEASSADETLAVRNAGSGSINVEVDGAVYCDNLFSTNLNNSNLATLEDVVINGDLTVNGTTISANSTITDYDVITITPTTVANPTALTISPDDEGQVGGGPYTYYGDLIKTYKRIAGTNSEAFRVDYLGNIRTTANTFVLSNCTYLNDGTKVDASIIQRAPQYISYVNEGFKYVPMSNTPSADKSFVAKKADGTSNVFYVTKGGNLWVENCVSIGGANPICWDGSQLVTLENFKFLNADQYFYDSPIHIQATGKSEWVIKNSNSSVSFYGSGLLGTPNVEFTTAYANFDQVNTYVRNLTLYGNLYMQPGAEIDGVDVGSHNHSGGNMGVRIPATSVYIGSPINSTSIQADHIDVHHVLVQNTVTAMVDGNTENGITVSYSGVSGSKKLNFQVHPFTVNLSNDCDGSVVVTNPAAGGTTFTIPVNVHDDSHDHSNLDGTTSSTWQLAAGTGPKIKTDGTNFELVNVAELGWVDLTVNNLTVMGTTTTLNTEEVTIEDAIITLASNQITPGADAGLNVERGATDAQLLWSEAIDRWTCGLQGSMSPIIRESDLNNSTNTETIQDIVGGMVTGATSNQDGISVTYDDVNGKLDFNVADFTINLAGDATGSLAVTNLSVPGNLTVDVRTTKYIDCAIPGCPLNEYGAYAIPLNTAARNDVAWKVVSTDSSGHLQTGWINTTSGATTATMDRVYASNDGYIRYYTPNNFATQILALGGTTKNSHTHLSAEITDASSVGSANKVVKFDGTGSFSTTGSITANGGFVGNASSASSLSNNPKINTVTFDATGDIVVEPYVELDNTSAQARYLTFVDDTIPGHKRLNMDTSYLYYYPSSNTLVTGVFSGALDGNAATASRWATTRNIALTGPVTGNTNIDGSGNVTIATTVTAGGHSHVSADITDAVSSPNTGNRLVLRDISGNFAAGTITATLNGNASTATKLSSARTFALTGGVTGTISSDLTSGVSISTTVTNDSHTHDGRYYTESEADGRFVNVTGDTMTGNLTMSSANIYLTSGYNIIHTTGTRLYRQAVDGWAMRSDSDQTTTSLYLTQGTNGAVIGRLYADSAYNQGFLHPSAGTWRMRVDTSGNGYFTGQVTATQFNGTATGAYYSA